MDLRELCSEDGARCAIAGQRQEPDVAVVTRVDKYDAATIGRGREGTLCTGSRQKALGDAASVGHLPVQVPVPREYDVGAIGAPNGARSAAEGQSLQRARAAVKQPELTRLTGGARDCHHDALPIGRYTRAHERTSGRH